MTKSNSNELREEIDKIIDTYCVTEHEAGIIKANILTVSAVEAFEQLITTHTNNMLDSIVGELDDGGYVAADDLVPPEWNKAVYKAQDLQRNRIKNIILRHRRK